MVVGHWICTFGVVSAPAYAHNKDLYLQKKKKKLTLETAKHLASLISGSTEFCRLIMAGVRKHCFLSVLETRCIHAFLNAFSAVDSLDIYTGVW